MSITKANRDLSLLHPDFREQVEKWIDHCKLEWVPIFVTEAVRSQARQNYLYESGRSRPWPVVTRTLHSNHTKWVAVDIASSGDQLYPSDKDWWRKVADIAKIYRIDRWYDLRNRDKPHFQWAWSKIKLTKKLQSWLGPLETINSLAWNEFDKIEDSETKKEIQQLLHDLNVHYRSLK